MTIDEAKVKIRELWAKRISREDAQAYVSTMSLDGEEVDVREFVDRLWQEKPENNPARNLTDLGNAELIVEKYRGLIHYSWERHLWLTWNGKNWEWDDGNRIVEYAIQTVRCIYSEAADEKKSPNTPSNQKVIPV
jgi:hypothetical protein